MIHLVGDTLVVLEASTLGTLVAPREVDSMFVVAAEHVE
jgi:hypothetical protein